MSTDTDTLAKRLLMARNRKGWTQGKTAVAAGLAQTTVGNIESGTRQSAGSLPKLAKALGVRYDWLANGEGEMDDASASVEQELPYSKQALYIAQQFDEIPVETGPVWMMLYSQINQLIQDAKQSLQATPAQAQGIETRPAALQPEPSKRKSRG